MSKRERSDTSQEDVELRATVLAKKCEPGGRISRGGGFSGPCPDIYRRTTANLGFDQIRSRNNARRSSEEHLVVVRYHLRPCDRLEQETLPLTPTQATRASLPGDSPFSKLSSRGDTSHLASNRCWTTVENNSALARRYPQARTLLGKM